MKNISYNSNIIDFVNTLEDDSINLVITSGPKYTLEELSQKDVLDYYIWQTLVNPVVALYPKVKSSGSVYVMLDSYRTADGSLLPIEPWVEIGVKRTSSWLPHSRIIWNHMEVLSHNKSGYINMYSTILMFIKDMKKLYNNWEFIDSLYLATQGKIERLFKSNKFLSFSEGIIDINIDDVLTSIGNENIIFDSGEICELNIKRSQDVIERLIFSSCPEGGNVCELYAKDEKVMQLSSRLNRNYIGHTTSYEVMEHLKGLIFD